MVVVVVVWAPPWGLESWRAQRGLLREQELLAHRRDPGFARPGQQRLHLLATAPPGWTRASCWTAAGECSLLGNPPGLDLDDQTLGSEEGAP